MNPKSHSYLDPEYDDLNIGCHISRLGTIESSAYLANNILGTIEIFYQLRGQKPSRNLINRSKDNFLEEELEP